MKIISVASLKGGCGKTSIACFLSLALAKRGLKTLAIDLDHNNDLTDFFLRDVDEDILENKNIYHALTRKSTLVECIYPHTFGLDILPATPELSRIGIELSQDGTSSLRLAAGLKKLEYQVVVIDTPPALCLELNIALYGSDIVLCPIQPTRWTVRGMALIKRALENSLETSGHKTKFYAIPTAVTLSESEKMKGLDLPYLKNCVITKTAAVRNAGITGKQLKPETKSAIDFEELAKILLKD